MGLCLVDGALAAAGSAGLIELVHDIVTEAETAARFAVLDPPAETPSGLLGKILQIERAHRALEADMEFAHFAFGERDDADVGKAHALVKAGNVLLVARQAIQRFRQDDVEAALQAIGDQFLHARPQQRRPGNRPVRIAVDDGPAFALGFGTAKAKLVLDRSVALIVRGVTGVERGLHGASLFGEAIAGRALPFGCDEFTSGLSRQKT